MTHCHRRNLRCFRARGPTLGCLGLGFLLASSGTVMAQDSTDVDLRSFEVAWQLVLESHFDTTYNGVDWRALGDSLRPQAAGVGRDSIRVLIRTMLGRLGQSHFSLIPKEAADEQEEESGGGGESGTGFEVRLLEGRIVVIRVDPEGPAAAAGVRPGWILEAVDGEDVDSAVERLKERPGRYGLGLRAWGRSRAWLQGEAGSTVRLRFLNGADRPVTHVLTRTRDRSIPVKFGLLPTFYARFDAGRERSPGGHQVGRIWFNTWMIPLVRQVDSAVDALRNVDGLVIDLRGNTGGAGAMVVGVAGHFTANRDTLGLFRTRDNTMRIIANPRLVSPDGRPVQPFAGPVAILTDEITGSASEVFAGGMQSIGRVRVFGSTSIGGVLPARWTRLPNGDVLYHAFADFVTRTGIVLEGRGVIPDQPVAVTRADLLAGRDPVLDAALRWIDQEAARSQGGRP